MKILSFILIFYILLLSSNPCCDENGSISANLIENDSGDHDNCSDICSPFFTCGSCTGFNSPPDSSSVDPELVLLNAEESNYYLPFDFDYINQIWQPPKIS